MHHANVIALIVFGADVAGVGPPGILDHGKRVKIGAHHHRGSRAIFQHSHKPVAAHIGSYRKPEWLDLRHQLGGRLLLLERQLRMRVKLPVEMLQGIQLLGRRPGNALAQVLRPKRQGHGQDSQKQSPSRGHENLRVPR
jgi:hypothetical protein